ncbi:hypothetical protein MALU111345_17240 [Marinicrinis lubricantis]
MKYSHYASYLFLIIFFLWGILFLNAGHEETFLRIKSVFEWVTRYVLPWIILYLLIRLVKNKR